MYNWDAYEPPVCKEWDLCGLLVYSETVEQNYNFMKLQATIPTYNEMGNPDGTETKLVLSGDDVKALMLRKYWTFKFLTGKYHNYTTNKMEDLVTTVGGAWTSLKKAYETWLKDNQVWVNKIAQALYILDNPADNYNKHVHSILTYKGSEKETWTPSGKEKTTVTPKGTESDTNVRTGSYTDNETISGKEKTTHNNASYDDTTAKIPFDGADNVWKNTEKLSHGAHNDYDETEYGVDNKDRTNNRSVTYSSLQDASTKSFSNDRKDETLKEFLEQRKDETTKEFTNRFDDYVLREWGNIGVTTYAQILTGIFGIANTAQLGDYLVNDFIHRNCVK